MNESEIKLKRCLKCGRKLTIDEDYFKDSIRILGVVIGIKTKETGEKDKWGFLCLSCLGKSPLDVSKMWEYLSEKDKDAG